MIPSFSPPPPGTVNARTFQDLRSFLMGYVVNKWMQYVTDYVQNTLLPPLNTASFNYGPDIASAATISPTALVQRITGTTPIATINAPQNFAGMFCGIAINGFSTVTSGNILLATSVPANHMAVFAYSPIGQKWGVVTS